MIAVLERVMADDETARRAIKVWMKDVLSSRNWTASEWARRAGTSPTNITRFLSPVSKLVPSGGTISKLARAAGSQPRLNPYVDVNATSAWQVALISAHTTAAFSPPLLWEHVMNSAVPKQTISVDGPLDGPAFVTDVPAMGMSARGIVPGDRILVEQCRTKDLAPGNVVLFRHDGAAKIGEWQGSMILFYPATPEPGLVPLRSSEVEVYGRVRRLIREL